MPSRFERPVSLSAFVSAYVLLLAACGAPGGPIDGPPGDVLRIATVESSHGMAALYTGIVDGTVNSDHTACFRLAEGAIPVIWPSGYWARPNPLRVLDNHGRTVVVAGERGRLAGGLASFGTS